MADLDLYWIFSQVLNLIVFGIFLVTILLIPSKEKIKSGEAGQNLLTPTIPLLLGIIFASTLIIPVVAIILQVNAFIVILITDGLLITANLFLTFDFIRSKRLFREISDQKASHIPQQHHSHHPDHPAVGPQVHQASLQGAQQQHLPQGGQQAVHAQAHQAVPQAPGQEHLPAASHDKMMTVECPSCGGHIHIPEGSHEITCPYCGLSGTL